MFYCSRDLANQRAALERCRSTDKQMTDEFRQTTGHTWAFTKYLCNAERIFTKIYFQLSIPIKDTANPLSHHTLASSNLFNWMQAFAPVKAKNTDVSYKTFLMSGRERKILIRIFCFKISIIVIGNWSYPTDLKDASCLPSSKNWTIKSINENSLS